ncbi:MAG: LuxR C-terminal-related transcriptional regulator [Candidatus Accumulibacter sp.]|jgi:LuxR family maltose regulon positive regulatory protein|nr:LuxR C-terminal-related transcriptional regulator [Accumulibacter sp.]
MTERSLQNPAVVTKNQHAHLDRPRVHELLATALRSPVVSVCAGAGYGKTSALHTFLQEYRAHKAWIRLSRHDNFRARFWENFTQAVSLNDKRLVARLADVGFPETDVDYEKYMRIPDESVDLQEKYVIVYDDLHLVYDKTVLHFLENCVHTPFPNITTVFVARAEPEINLIGMMAKGLVATITESDLRFTKGEIAEYLHLQGLTVSPQELAEICAGTEGWPFAVSLIARSLKRNPERPSYAYAAMKLNVFKLLETEALLAMSERLRRFLVRLSLVDHFSAELVRELAGDDALLEELPRVGAYVRHDSHTDAYLVNPLFLEFLRGRQDRLSAEEKRQTYLAAARWCSRNDYQIDAVSYYEKIGEYGEIVRIVFDMSTPIAESTARYFLKIFENTPPVIAKSIDIFPMMHLRLLLSLRQFAGAVALGHRYVRELEERPVSAFNDRVLSSVHVELGFASWLAAPETDVYDFDVHLARADTYRSRHPRPAITLANNQLIGPWASMVGTERKGSLDEYAQACSRTAATRTHAIAGNLSCLDELARAELYFVRGHLKLAEQFLLLTLQKTRERNQYDVRNRALLYLLRIAFAQGDYAKTEQVAGELETQLEVPDYSARYITYDIVMGWYRLMLGEPELIADWLKTDFEQGSASAPMFLGVFANRIRMRYFFLTRQYHKLLAFLEGSREMKRYLFGRIYVKTREALCCYHIKERDRALAALREAWEISHANEIVSAFVELGKDMRTLVAAALRDGNTGIPRDWLENIHRRSATFAKRQQIVIAAYRKANHLGDEIRLSPRETEVLTDLYQGLSRSETALAHNLSINTVKLVINTLYAKLNANNVSDLVRIAGEKRLIR